MSTAPWLVGNPPREEQQAHPDYQRACRAVLEETVAIGDLSDSGPLTRDEADWCWHETGVTVIEAKAVELGTEFLLGPDGNLPIWDLRENYRTDADYIRACTAAFEGR